MGTDNYISNEFPSDADATVMGIAFENHWPKLPLGFNRRKRQSHVPSPGEARWHVRETRE